MRTLAQKLNIKIHQTQKISLWKSHPNLIPLKIYGGGFKRRFFGYVFHLVFSCLEVNVCRIVPVDIFKTVVVAAKNAVNNV